MKRTNRHLLLAAGLALAGSIAVMAVAQTTSSQGDSSRTESSRGESSRGDFRRGDSSRTESSRDWRSDPSRFERFRSGETTRTDSGRTDWRSGGDSRGDSRSDSRGDSRSDSRDRGSYSSRFGSNSTPAGPESAGYSDFAVITQQNIFLRNRRTFTPPPPSTSSSNASQPKPEELFVLRGIAIQDNTYLGVIENLRTAETVKVQLGDSIAQGKITEMQLDYLEYESASGARTRVSVGLNLAGGQGVASSPTAGGSSSSSSPPASPEEAAILERLRQKRLAEGRR